MAPGKKKADGEGNSTKRVARNETGRVTRSVTRKQNSNSALLVSAEVPKKQKKNKAKTPKKNKAATASIVKKPRSEEAETDDTDVGKKTEQAADDSGPPKVIFIERCTQCSSFKKAATSLKEGLEAAVPGIRVIINQEKPRRGCLEVKEDGGLVFLSLLNMKRPFTPMKELDMEKVISDIADQIKD